MTTRKSQESAIDVAIVGAGPYGLSLAAHLRASGVDCRIFGNPMSTWLTQMPKGMRLKSEGFASSLSEPDSIFTLARYCKEVGLPYSDLGLPVPLSTFTAYGLEFQKRYVPNLERKQVDSVSRSPDGFQICLEDGEVVLARRVVLAIGITHFAYVPPVLSELPDDCVTHSSQHGDLESLKGKQVAVVGAGASALDLASLLRQAGATVQLIARTSVIRFHDPPTGKPRTFRQKLNRPMTGIGSGWRLFFCTRAPHLFHLLPERIRLAAVRKTLGPAPAWFVKEEVVGSVSFHLGVEVTAARIEDGRVTLELTESSGVQRQLTFDHVIAATGYQVNLRRLRFLDAEMMAGINSVEQTPVLSLNFESSVPGLYFVGTSAANSFGPVMRFAFGAEYVARRLSAHLAKMACRQRTHQKQVSNVPLVDGESRQTL